MNPTRTLILGLGNPILGDDGVGWRVAEKVRKQLKGQTDTEVDCLSLGGLSLMERLTGYQRVILIDALFTGQKPVGTVSRFVLSDLPDLTAGHTTSAHDTSLRTALNVGRSMQVPLPEDENVLVIAIEAQQVYEFTEELSPPVQAAVPEAIKAVLSLIH